MNLLPNIGMIWSLVSYLEQPPHNFLAQKGFCPLNRRIFGEKSSYTLEGSTKDTDYFETIVHNYNKISTFFTNIFV